MGKFPFYAFWDLVYAEGLMMNRLFSRLSYSAGGFVVVMILMLSESMSSGSTILDQSTLGTSYRGGWAISNGRELAQVITTSVGGCLSRIDLQILRDMGAPGDVTLRIRRTVNGVPTSPNTPADIVRTIPYSALPLNIGSQGAVPITSVDVSDAVFMVSPGEQLAITVKLTAVGGGAPPWTIYCDGTNISGSQFYFSYFNTWKTSSSTAGIQTWVDVPEPATLSLLAIGGLAMLKRRKTV